MEDEELTADKEDAWIIQLGKGHDSVSTPNPQGPLAQLDSAMSWEDVQSEKVQNDDGVCIRGCCKDGGAGQGDQPPHATTASAKREADSCFRGPDPWTESRSC